MKQTILDFPKQLAWEPKIENVEWLKHAESFVVAGMGGSALAADLLTVWDPNLALVTHRDYGLPPLPESELKKRLIIINSYSGNTEETLDAYDAAKEKGLNIIAISLGGKLLQKAKSDVIPYIQLLDTGIPPRAALGFSLKALLKAMGDERVAKDLVGIGKSLEVLGAGAFEEQGFKLALRVKNYIPIIYTSRRNYPIAYNWKIKFNETAKIPAFCNYFPELNHNEMAGFNFVDKSHALSEKIYFIFLADSADHPRILRRMEVLEKLFKGHNLKAESQELVGVNIFHKIFTSLLIADWTVYYLAKDYGVDPDANPAVEEFKKLV